MNNAGNRGEVKNGKVDVGVMDFSNELSNVLATLETEV
jgi:hypothetical protein